MSESWVSRSRDRATSAVKDGRTTLSAMNAAASQLRALVMQKEEGEFLGDESELLVRLGVSRMTLRQIARLLEREGLLSVKRGSNGGYFACRPSFESMEATLSAFLEVLHVDIRDMLAVASVTWAETVRQAAALRSDEARALARRLSDTVRAVDPTISYRRLIAIEQEIRSDLFELIDSPYMKFIFQVNVRFAQRFEGPDQIPDVLGDHEAFVAAWRSAKLLELEAIALGDTELGSLAAQRTRSVWGAMITQTG